MVDIVLLKNLVQNFHTWAAAIHVPSRRHDLDIVDILNLVYTHIMQHLVYLLAIPLLHHRKLLLRPAVDWWPRVPAIARVLVKGIQHRLDLTADLSWL